MPTASNGNGHSGNGVIPISESGAPLVLGGLAIAGSPLDVAELERLANEMFRAGPEGAGLGPDTPDVPEVSGESIMGELPVVPDRLNGTAVGDGSGSSPEPELLQRAYLVDGAVPSSPGAAPAVEPDPRAAPATPSAPKPMPAADPRTGSAPSSAAGAADLFALHGERLSLAELGLAEVPRVSAADPAAGSYYFMDESRSFATSETSRGGAPSPAAPGTGTSAYPAFDVQAVRRDFPVLAEHVHGGLPLVWLDNAATTQKPTAVMSRLDYFYSHENSNVHRAAHEMAARATDAYEAARDKVARFLHAPSSDEIVFVRGATEAINLVAQAWGRQNVRAGDEIVITWLEHHANIVPWQQLCQETGATLRVVPVDQSGQVMLDEYEKLLGPSTRLVAFSHVSNALGTVTPAREMVEMAHRYGARVLVDGAQAVSHMRVDVQDLDCDWYAFSGHKVFGPTGIGVLYGKADLLNAMPPWQGGGNMIRDVTFERTSYQPAPVRFEAGTASIADAVGLGAALDYLQRIGIENVNRYEQDLLAYATEQLLTVPGLHLIGTAPEKASVLSFVLDGFEAEEVGRALDQKGIAVRAGHHCAQPNVRHFGHESTVRASLAFYNTCAEVDTLVEALRQIVMRGVQL
jgi:cysteine desulfurase/selenocysteine lyase